VLSASIARLVAVALAVLLSLTGSGLEVVADHLVEDTRQPGLTMLGVAR